MHHSRFIASILVFSFASCVTPKSKEDGGDDDDDTTEGTTIYDLQQGLVEEGSPVTLRDVIASTPVSLAGNGFFVQDPAGGQYSGIYVYLQGAEAPLFSLYDELTISGTFTEYQPDTGDPTTISELTVNSGTAIEVTGSGSLTPEALGAEADWEPWAGVLAVLSDQEVLDCENSYGEVNLGAGLEMDDAYYDFETEKGATYSAITGPIHYNYGDWTIFPRQASDLEGYAAGAGCTVTCADIQQGDAAGGVELENVVVTGPLNVTDNGFWVQDQGGGQWSGMYIYLYSGVTVSVSVGDVVSITGGATEYYDLTEVSISSSDDVVQSGTTASPVADTLSSAPSDWEPYESGLLRLEGIAITSDPDSYNEVETSWGIKVDDFIYDAGLSNGLDCDYLQGLLTYNYDEWKLLPRDADDVSCN